MEGRRGGEGELTRVPPILHAGKISPDECNMWVDAVEHCVDYLKLNRMR